MEQASLKIVLLVLCLFCVRTDLKASRWFSEKLNQLQRDMKTAEGNPCFHNYLRILLFLLIFVVWFKWCLPVTHPPNLCLPRYEPGCSQHAEYRRYWPGPGGTHGPTKACQPRFGKASGVWLDFLPYSWLRAVYVCTAHYCRVLLSIPSLSRVRKTFNI